jgi:hypothetical protein
MDRQSPARYDPDRRLAPLSQRSVDALGARQITGRAVPARRRRGGSRACRRKSHPARPAVAARRPGAVGHYLETLGAAVAFWFGSDAESGAESV